MSEFFIVEYTCPYCGNEGRAPILEKRRIGHICPACGKVNVFDFNGAGYFGLWRFEVCDRCYNRRIMRDDNWRCVKHGCVEVEPCR